MQITIIQVNLNNLTLKKKFYLFFKLNLLTYFFISTKETNRIRRYKEKILRIEETKIEETWYIYSNEILYFDNVFKLKSIDFLK